MPPTAIAVIGGGITGLTSAFHLSRRFPDSSITVFEATNRAGGWIRSRRVQVKDATTGAEADVVLEAGPRTLMPTSNALLELINLLNLQHSLITIPKSSSAAKHRFLHIPGREGLTSLFFSSFPRLPTPYVSSILIPAIARDALRLPTRAQTRPEEDESLSSFLVRHFGSKFERIFGSALIHGIYAADARILSTHAAFPTLARAEERGNGSVFRGLLGRKQENDAAGYDLGSMQDLLKDASVFSFRDGLESIPRALTSHLDSTRSVCISTSTRVSKLRRTDSGNFEIRTSSGEHQEFSHIVSTVPLPMLDTLLPPPGNLPHLKANPSSSVTTINIIFPPCKQPIHPPGFGYLVPRPENGYENATNSGFLGVVFDSCTLSAQDRVSGLSKNASGFTKITAMLGGPYNLTPAHTEVENVLAELQNHLSPTKQASNGKARLPWPVYFETHEHKDCIPIPTVGHVRRMDELRSALKQEPWKGRLEVVGAGVGGVSVPNCITAGREVGKEW